MGKFKDMLMEKANKELNKFVQEKGRELTPEEIKQANHIVAQGIARLEREAPSYGDPSYEAPKIVIVDETLADLRRYIGSLNDNIVIRHPDGSVAIGERIKPNLTDPFPEPLPRGWMLPFNPPNLPTTMPVPDYSQQPPAVDRLIGGAGGRRFPVTPRDTTMPVPDTGAGTGL